MKACESVIEYYHIEYIDGNKAHWELPNVYWLVFNWEIEIVVYKVASNGQNVLNPITEGKNETSERRRRRST